MKAVSSLARSSTGKAISGSMATSVVAKIAQIAMSILAARLLQPSGFGLFTFALGVGLLGGRLAGLGWPVLMNRFVPRYVVEQEWDRLLALLRSSEAVAFAGALLTGVICVAFALVLGQEDKLYPGLIYGALLVPAMAFRSLYRNTLAALYVPHKGIMVDELLPATIMVGALLLLMFTDPSAQIVIVAYTAGSVVAVAAGKLWIGNKLPFQLRSAKPDYSGFKFWMATALPALVGMSARLFMNKTDILMLAPLGTLEDVGFYGAALRTTYIQTAAVVVLSTVITARISKAFASGRERQGKRLFYGALGFALGCSVPFAILLVLYDQWIITTLYGAEYLPAAPVLQILALSQIGAALIIPASSFMLMTGRQVRFGQLTTLCLVVNVVLNLLLIPSMGATGAALATCISISGLATAQLVGCMLIIRSRRYAEKGQSQ